MDLSVEPVPLPGLDRFERTGERYLVASPPEPNLVQCLGGGQGLFIEECEQDLPLTLSPTSVGYSPVGSKFPCPRHAGHSAQFLQICGIDLSFAAFGTSRRRERDVDASIRTQRQNGG